MATCGDGLQRYTDSGAINGRGRRVQCTGNNPTTVCNKCAGDRLEIRCTCNDPFGGFAGAFECMAGGTGDVAFVRNSTVQEYVALPNVTMTEQVRPP